MFSSIDNNIEEKKKYIVEPVCSDPCDYESDSSISVAPGQYGIE